MIIDYTISLRSQFEFMKKLAEHIEDPNNSKWFGETCQYFIAFLISEINRYHSEEKIQVTGLAKLLDEVVTTFLNHLTKQRIGAYVAEKYPGSLFEQFKSELKVHTK